MTTKTELINTANGNEILATKTSAPFDSFSWDSTGVTGSVSLAVRWYVDDELVETSSAVGITVNAQPVSYSTEAQAVFANMATDPATAYKNAIANLVDGLVTDGVYSKIREIQCPALDTSANRLKGWKGVRNATISGGVTNTAKVGAVYNGVDGYTDTGFIPSTDGGGIYTLNSADILHFISNSNVPSGAKNISGSYPASSSGRVGLAFDKVNDSVLARVNTLITLSVSATSFDANSSYVLHRATATNQQIFKNGVSIATGTDNSGILSDVPYYEGCANVNGTATAFIDATVLIRIFGGGWTTQNHADIHARIAQFKTDLEAIA